MADTKDSLSIHVPEINIIGEEDGIIHFVYEFKKEAKDWAAFTRKNMGRTVAFWINDLFISTIQVSSEIKANKFDFYIKNDVLFSLMGETGKNTIITLETE